MLDLAGVSFMFIKSSGCLLFSLKMFPLPEQCAQEQHAVTSRGHGHYMAIAFKIKYKLIAFLKTVNQNPTVFFFLPFSRSLQVSFFTQKD